MQEGEAQQQCLLLQQRKSKRFFSLAMLPDLLIKEIVSFLDFDSLKELRLISRDFNFAAAPILFRFHRLQANTSEEYTTFQFCYGQYVKLLEADRSSIALPRSKWMGLPVIFPNVCYIYLHWERYQYPEDHKRFIEDCLAFENLKAVIVQPMPNYNLGKYYNGYHYDFKNILTEQYEPMKEIDACILWSDIDNLLLMYPVFFNSYRKEKLIVESIKGATHFYAVIPKNKHKIDLTKIDGRRHREEIGSIHFSLDYFKELVHGPAIISHILVFSQNGFEMDPDYLSPLLKVPSLDFQVTNQTQFKPLEISMEATQVSFEVDEVHSRSWLYWSSRCFANLQNLYFNTLVPDNEAPLEKGTFPNLIHFYTNVSQPRSFWEGLVTAAPKLVFIHPERVTDDLLHLKSAHPHLIFLPYRNILGNPSDLCSFLHRYV